MTKCTLLVNWDLSLVWYISSGCIKNMKINPRNKKRKAVLLKHNKYNLIDSCYQDLLDSSAQAWSIELCEFRIFRSEFQPMLMYLFSFSFLTTLYIYKTYLKVVIHGYKDQEFNFLCEKLLCLYAIGFCNQVLLDLHCW